LALGINVQEQEPENHPVVCSDNVDNDSDGLTDCADPDCEPVCGTSEPENHPVVCSDNVDNDLDGLTDCADPDCGPVC
jgi:hypothetical protein